MSIAVISYSFTGNNRKLAAAVAEAIAAEHIEITTDKPQTEGTIIADMLFNRTPKVRLQPSALERYERILFIAPVWMGQVASPLRAYLKHIKTHPKPYAFASISGGALNPNPKLAEGITKRAGNKPAAFLDMHIAELFVIGKEQVKTKETGEYILTDADVETIIGILKESPVWKFCRNP